MGVRRGTEVQGAGIGRCSLELLEGSQRALGFRVRVVTMFQTQGTLACVWWSPLRLAGGRKVVVSQDGRQTQRRLRIHLNQLRVISAEVGRV